MQPEEIDAIEASEPVDYRSDWADTVRIAVVVRLGKVQSLAARASVLTLAAWVALHVLAAPATLQAIGVAATR